jgi:hypothetical protein
MSTTIQLPDGTIIPSFDVPRDRVYYINVSADSEDDTLIYTISTRRYASTVAAIMLDGTIEAVEPIVPVYRQPG